MTAGVVIAIYCTSRWLLYWSETVPDVRIYAGNSLALWLDKVDPARSCVISIECTVHCIRRCPAAGSYTIGLSVGLNCELLSWAVIDFVLSLQILNTFSTSCF